MRLLTPLTLQGRILLTGGVTAALCAWVFGQETLLRAGLFVALLPIMALLLLARRPTVKSVRTLSTPQVRVGEQVRVRLEVSLERGARSVWRELVDSSSVPALTPHTTLLSAEGPDTELAWTVRGHVRGRHRVGPAHLVGRDPLGLAVQRHVLDTPTPFVVLPGVVELPRRNLASPDASTSASTTQHQAGTHRDATVRPYQVGDDVRRIHWRSSARAAELMVRRDEVRHRPEVTLLFDSRRSAHRGQGAQSSFELGVAVTASVLHHLLSSGNDVRLVTAAGPVASLRSSAPSEWTEVWEHLAVLSPHDPDPAAATFTATLDEPLAEVWSGRDSWCVAVLAGISPDDHVVLTSAADRVARCEALLLDLQPWTGAAAPVTLPRWNQRSVASIDELPLSWEALG